MNPNWLGIAAAIGSFVAFWLTFRTTAALERRKRFLLAAVATLLALPGASFTIYYAHFLPETAWYYEFRSWRGTEFLLLFVGVAGGLWVTLLPRLFRLAPLLGTLFFAIVPFMKPFIGPLDLESLRNTWDREVCLQSTPSTCGLASVATILRSLGLETTEREIARTAHTYAGGTEAWYLARFIRSKGYTTRFTFSPAPISEGALPAVIGVRIAGVGHFIPILSRDADTFLIGDPLRGRESITLSQLRRRYEFTGFKMSITAGDGERSRAPD